jgi:hypothetical protein
MLGPTHSSGRPINPRNPSSEPESPPPLQAPAPLSPRPRIRLTLGAGQAARPLPDDIAGEWDTLTGRPLRPSTPERDKAEQIAADITHAQRAQNDLELYRKGIVPFEKAGERPPSPGETAMLRDFDQRRRAFRDPDTGERFQDLRNRGEFHSTYGRGFDPNTGAPGLVERKFEFAFDREVLPSPIGTSSTSARIHTHPDFTLQMPSPADHRFAAKAYAHHGERNYLVDSKNRAFIFGPTANGPQFTRLTPIDLGSPPASPVPSTSRTPAHTGSGSIAEGPHDIPGPSTPSAKPDSPMDESSFWR